MYYVVVVDVHQHGDGLANDERDPDCRIAIVTSQEAADEPGEWNLRHHAHERPQSEHFQRNAHQVLVKEGGDQEDGCLSDPLIHTSPHERLVKVAEAPLVHRNVPVRPEISDRLRVPPVLVKLPVAEPHQLSYEVHGRVEKPIEKDEPD